MNILSKFQVPLLIRFGRKGVLKIFEQKDDRLTELMNYKGVCRTALATPGLLNTPYSIADFDLC